MVHLMPAKVSYCQMHYLDYFTVSLGNFSESPVACSVGNLELLEVASQQCGLKFGKEL